jgi:catechol 2,3-dioxygenase-like lactoylglutathione lyase family enzyme
MKLRIMSLNAAVERTAFSRRSLLRWGSRGEPMGTLSTIELKAFVPASDFALSKQFYQDLGFTMSWSDNELAYMHHGTSSFLLQNFYVKALADNFMMHLLVEDVDAWWDNVNEKQIGQKYSVKILPPEQRPWGMRDFVVIDPSGVLWRIAEKRA